MENKKIVVIGGTFNPPTLAHIDLAKRAKTHVNADLVILVPTKSDYMKSWKKYQNSDIYPDELRVETIKSCETEWLKIDTCEIDGVVSGKSYDTLQYIKNKYRTDDVYFAVGTDKLNEIPRWAKSTLFLSTEKFIVMQRNNDDINSIIENNKKLKRYSSAFTICPADKKYQWFSSTKVREFLSSSDLNEQEKAKKLVPESVWNVLKKYQVVDCKQNISNLIFNE